MTEHNHAEVNLTNVQEELRRLIVTAPAGGVFTHANLPRPVKPLHEGFANEVQSFTVEIDGYSFLVSVERNPHYNGRLAS